MNGPEHAIYREWLNLEADGRLPREEKARLEDHLAACSACRSERDELRALEGLLHRSRVPVREGFRADVMAALPVTGWESRAPRAWTAPAALCVLLGIVAAAVMGSSSALAESSGLGTLSAVLGMFQAAFLAGSGLLAATWKGLGLVFEEVLASPVSLGMFGLLVLCLNFLLVAMIRRRNAAARSAEAAPRSLRRLDRPRR